MLVILDIQEVEIGRIHGSRLGLCGGGEGEGKEVS
jgi:hypothetical protein